MILLAPLTVEEAATAGAMLASEATVELLRFVREGEAGANSPFADEVVSKLAEALVRAIDIEGPIFDPVTHPDAAEREQGIRDTLRSAALNYIEERIA